MADVQYDHPLKLPPSWSATPFSEREFCRQFPANLVLDDALRFLEEEIQALGLASPVIYTNSVALNNPRNRKVDTRSAGVSIQFGSRSNTAWLACDKWQSLEHNLYALHLTIRALRNIEGWGIAPASYIIQSLSADTHHHHALPSTTTTSDDPHILPDWMSILGLGPTADLEDANAVYRRRAKMVAENEAELLMLNQAMDEARKHLR